MAPRLTTFLDLAFQFLSPTEGDLLGGCFLKSVPSCCDHVGRHQLPFRSQALEVVGCQLRNLKDSRPSAGRALPAVLSWGLRMPVALPWGSWIWFCLAWSSSTDLPVMK